MDNPPIRWFCCLNSAESAVLRATAEGLALTLYLGIPFTLWDAFWLATTHNEDIFKEAFLHLYHLETATVDVDGIPTLVVRPVSGYEALWVSYFVFVFTPDAACLDGCTLSKLPWQY